MLVCSIRRKQESDNGSKRSRFASAEARPWMFESMVPRSPFPLPANIPCNKFVRRASYRYSSNASLLGPHALALPCYKRASAVP